MMLVVKLCSGRLGKGEPRIPDPAARSLEEAGGRVGCSRKLAGLRLPGQ